jgi:alpha-amylase
MGLFFADVQYIARMIKEFLRTAFRMAALFLFLAATANAQDLWEKQSIYQIITDRFYDGDPSNNNADDNFDPGGHRGTSVHGGDFKGIEEKLDYIKALGATAIWISPVVLNDRGEFHGYAARDFYKVDPHWGTLADLQKMVRAAHARGLLVIDDVVVNHGGDLVDSEDAGYPNFVYPPKGYTLRYRNPSREYAPPFDPASSHRPLDDLFHNNGEIQSYKDPDEVQLGELNGLDDFRTESAYVRKAMADIYEYWIAQAGFDAYRIDTVKHVDMGFWRAWCPAIHQFAAAHGKPNFFMFGEVYDGSEAKCGSYTGTIGGGPFKLDSVLDYPLYFKINSVFGRADGNTKQIEDHYAAISANYAPSAQMRLVTFLDNHDQPRFLSRRNANGNSERLKVALTFLYTARGIPCLYYGTEQAFDGGKDPYDREDMFAGKFEWGPSLGDNFNMTHPLFQLVARLNNLRRLYPALQTGVHRNLWCDGHGPGLFAYARHLGSQEVFIVLNTAGLPQTLPGRPTAYSPGEKLVNLLDTRDNIIIQTGPKTPAVTMPATSAKIFIAQSQMLPLDPVVVSVAPTHDSRDVSASSPITIQFSEAMDPASVETAFSIEPPMDGAFGWSPAHDKMTFTPLSGSFPTGAMIDVHLAETAKDALNQTPMHGGFASRFRTTSP